jgi:hypothetical protein
MDNLIFNLDRMDETKIRVVISDMNLIQKGILYFEKVKVGFNRKPISMNSWACIDAKIEGLYDMGGDYTSLDILNKCQLLISSLVSVNEHIIDGHDKPTDDKGSK